MMKQEIGEANVTLEQFMIGISKMFLNQSDSSDDQSHDLDNEGSSIHEDAEERQTWAPRQTADGKLEESGPMMLMRRTTLTKD